MIGSSTIEISWTRTWSRFGHSYLLTLELETRLVATALLAYPQARAVVDDFGTLVIVTEWK